MVGRTSKLLFSIFTLLFVLVACENDDKDNEDDAPIVNVVRYPDTLIAYEPAPSQFANKKPCLIEDAQGIIDGHGLVSLGGWGGYIVVGFEKAIINKTDSAYGVDFTIIGNAYDGNSEPGVVFVMQDENGNGEADDTWYELKGSEYDNDTTNHDYVVTYYYHEDSTVTWKDNMQNSGSILRNEYHKQSYYPQGMFTREYPKDSIVFSGILLPTNMRKSSPTTWTTLSYDYGYADNYGTIFGEDFNYPDDPSTPEVEGCGGDPFMLEWAVDEDGNAVALDSIHFIKVQSAVFDSNPRTGDVSCEIKAIVPTK